MQITVAINKHCLNDVLPELFDNFIEGVTVLLLSIRHRASGVWHTLL